MSVIDLAAVRARRAAAAAIVRAHMGGLRDRAREAAEDIVATVRSEPDLTVPFVERAYLSALWGLIDEVQTDLRAVGLPAAEIGRVSLEIAAHLEERIDEMVAEMPACDRALEVSA